MTAQISIIAQDATAVTVHKGRTVETIVRRLYGPKATIRYAADRNRPEVGVIVTPAGQNQWNVHARLFAISGDEQYYPNNSEPA